MDFDKLKFREKVIVAGLVVAVAVSAYMNLIHKSFSKRVSGYQLLIKKSEAQLNGLKMKYPSTEKQKEKIQSLNAECDHLVKEVSELEKKLPSKNDTSQLIGEFTRLAKEAKLISIKQKVVTQEGYQQILIEEELNANYLAAIHYITKIESISPFLNIEQVDINESKGKTFEEGGSPVRLVVSSLLGDVSIDQALKAQETAEGPVVKRDILASKAKAEVALDEKEFKLEGVTYNPDNPTAIINGDVFREDSQIKGLKVKKILPDSVVLTDGVQEHLLKINR